MEYETLVNEGKIIITIDGKEFELPCSVHNFIEEYFYPTKRLKQFLRARKLYKLSIKRKTVNLNIPLKTGSDNNA